MNDVHEFKGIIMCAFKFVNNFDTQSLCCVLLFFNYLKKYKPREPCSMFFSNYSVALMYVIYFRSSSPIMLL